MAIQIKAVERGQPGVAGGGAKKYYASPVHGREITPGKKLQDMLKTAKFTKG